jgi:glutamate--cysteine ligase catalytic subunit
LINGQDGAFEGFIPIIKSYLDSQQIPHEQRCKFDKYLTLISKRASGELLTTAAYLRHVVTTHRSYHSDSIVSEEIAHDLIEIAEKIGKGELYPCELFP